MIVYSWVSSPTAKTTPFIWVKLEIGDTPEQAANKVIPQLKARPAGQRVLFMWWSMRGAFDASPVEIVAKGPAITDLRKWTREFYQRLNIAGCEVDRIVLDMEMGFSVWHVFKGMDCGQPRIDAMKAIYSDPAAYAKLPESVKVFKPEDYTCHTGTGRQAYIAWNNWASDVEAAATRSVYVATANCAFDKTIAASNYGDGAYGFPMVDINNWPMPKHMIGNWLSPCLYLWGYGQAFGPIFGRKKSPPWNGFVHCVNLLRSCMNASAYMIPWISYPSFDEGGSSKTSVKRWLWVELLKHMRATGVKYVLYWNPWASQMLDDEKLASDTFSALAKVPPVRRKLTEVPWDAEEVVTANVTTTYADYMALVNQA